MERLSQVLRAIEVLTLRFQVNCLSKAAHRRHAQRDVKLVKAASSVGQPAPRVATDGLDDDHGPAASVKILDGLAR